MANDKSILSGALSHMNTLSTSLPIAWPGIKFTPPNNGMWFEVRHFPNEPNHFPWGDGKQEYIGFLQVSVFTRPNLGLFGAMDEAEKIVAHFSKETAFGPVVVSRTPYLLSPIAEDTHIQIPVTIQYRGVA